ncbi:MAG: M23 family metallopeptidase [Clostridia bacterium]|nr:M23 family metallopeptidase [Clostridia bacterium]
MKRLLFLLFPIVIMGLMALLYINADDFNNNNINSIILNGETLNLNDSSVQLFKDTLLRLDEASQESITEYYLKWEVNLEKKFGNDLAFQVLLNDNYENVHIKSLQSNKYYVIKGDLAHYLYGLDDASSLYEYQYLPEITLLINDSPVDTKTEFRWQYELGDEKWYETSKSLGESFTFTTASSHNEFELISSKAFNGMSTSIYDEEDVLIHQGDLKDFVFDHEGLYRIEMTLNWQDKHLSGESTTQFMVNYDLPVFVSLQKPIVEQGETTVILVDHLNDPDSLTLYQSYMEGLSFKTINDQYVCFIPSTYYTDLGTYEFTVTADGEVFTKTLEVVSRDFELQFLTVDEKTTQSTQTAEAYAEYNKYYKGALKESVHPDVNNFSEQIFILPAYGRLTTEFGVNRYVNNKPTSYHHAGWDIANAIGTDVIAAGEGTVALSMYLQVTGNTIVISHGNGIFTTYFHLNERLIEAGEVVESGTLIGKMGTTGFSTGSHLHFGISYYEMNLEPGYFIFGERITYNNYKNYFREE